MILVSVGAAIGVYSGSVAALFEDVKALRPSFFVGVPRTFSKILDGVSVKMAQKSDEERKIYRKAVEEKLEARRSQGTSSHPQWDKLIFDKISDGLFGKKVRFFICGAAALDLPSQELMEVSW